MQAINEIKTAIPVQLNLTTAHSPLGPLIVIFDGRVILTPEKDDSSTRTQRIMMQAAASSLKTRVSQGSDPFPVF